jgi:hypothetical protein
MLNLDLSNAQENTPIPDGTYAAICNKAEVVPTKSGTGTLIKIQLKILEGQPQAGRVIFDIFNIENSNPQAVQIGLGQLRTFMKQWGHPNSNMLKTTEELLGLKGNVTVKTVDDGGSFGPQTKVRAYKPLGEGQTATPTPGFAASAPAAKAANGSAANPFA